MPLRLGGVKPTRNHLIIEPPRQRPCPHYVPKSVIVRPSEEGKGLSLATLTSMKHTNSSVLGLVSGYLATGVTL